MVSKTFLSTDLTKDEQSSLLRIRPNFDHDLQAVTEFLYNTSSKQAIILHSDEPFFVAANQRMMTMMRMKDVCIHKNLMVPSDGDVSIIASRF